MIDGKYLICTPGGDEAIVVALNKATGELVWKTAAPTVGDKGGDGAAFSSMVKARIGEIDMYVQLVGRGLSVSSVVEEDISGATTISVQISSIFRPPLSRMTMCFLPTGITPVASCSS